MIQDDLNHEAVKAYRDQFRFCPSSYRRREIVVTVKDLDLWKEVLANWGYWKEGKWIKFNPLNVNGMIQEYERQARNTNRISKPRTGGENSQAGVSERRERDLLRLREGTNLHVRGVRKTLAEIVTAALREEDRP